MISNILFIQKSQVSETFAISRPTLQVNLALILSVKYEHTPWEIVRFFPAPLFTLTEVTTSPQLTQGSDSEML